MSIKAQPHGDSLFALGGLRISVSSTPTPGTGVGVPHRNGQPQRNGHVPFIWHHL
jgi:hypothetical protein